MKILYLLVALILTISITSFSQDGMDKMMRQRNKIHQLEKIKLIDELNLDEETSVKFFARRNEMQKEVEKLEDKDDEIIKELEKSIQTKDKNSEVVQKQLLADLLKTREKIEKTKRQFIDSIKDILTTEQIAKLVVFEQRFREEIRRIILNRRHSTKNEG